MFQRWIDRIETSDDLVHGQVVIIAARWILVIVGLMLAVWDPNAMGELRIQIVLVLGLAVANFYLHSQALMRKPISAPVVLAASAGDLTVISLIIISQGGFESNVFVFFFPAILAFSVAFRTQITYLLAGSAIAIYGIIAGSSESLVNPMRGESGEDKRFRITLLCFGEVSAGAIDQTLPGHSSAA